MKTIIGISTFSFDCSHFVSFAELEEQFQKFPPLHESFGLFKVSLAIANDILHEKTFGLSVNEQIQNFEFGTDRGAITRFRILLDRKYMRGFDRSFTNTDLTRKAEMGPCKVKNENTVLYSPSSLGQAPYLVANQPVFFNHYEYILGHFPVDNESYYEKATKYFKNLVFHPECPNTLERVTDDFCNYSVAFTKCLKALNDLCPIEITPTPDKLAAISSKAQYACTSEGTSHSNFKFNFTYKGQSYQSLDCQFHLKPSDRNQAGDSSHNHKRLYFGFIPESNGVWQIAVASMGPHINKENLQDRYAPLRDKRRKRK